MRQGVRPLLLHHLLDESASRAPDAPALIEPKRSLTYAQLAGTSLRASAALADAGVSPGDLVGLWSEKTSFAVAAAYGISRRGGAYVPIDPAAPPARAALILERVGARTVATTADRLEVFAALKAEGRLPDLRSVVLVADRAEASAGDGVRVIAAADADVAAPDARVTDGHLAYVLHTSGSTGVPKGVAISHYNALAFVEPAADHFAITAEDRLACQAPLHFDLSVFDLYCAALKGAAVVSFPEYFTAFPKKMGQAIDEHGVTIWNSVVSALGLLVDKGAPSSVRGESLRAILFSGERMPVPLLRRVQSRFPRATLFNVYGQTEANSSLVQRIDEIPADEGASLPLGQALPNFEVFLLGDAGDVVTAAEGQGELCVRAGTVAAGGYLRAPELAKEKFVADPGLPDSGGKVYRTGDLVRRTAAGELYFIGRRDSMIKTRGHRVELGEIEQAFEAIGGVLEVAVIAVPSEEIGHLLRAFVIAAPGASLAAQALEAELAKRLPQYMIPSSIAVVATLPRTSTGKIDRKALAAESL